MKKIICLIICILLLIVCVACTAQVENEDKSTTSGTEQNSSTIIPDKHIFTGEVLSVEKGMILVSPDEQNSAISPEVFVNVSQFSELKFEKGDRVKVIFNGQVAQSFPPQILGVINIEIIE